MRQQLLERADALGLAPAARQALFARLHFATAGLPALDGPLPALLREQWQEMRPAVLARPLGFSGDAEQLEEAAGPPPVSLPAPQPAKPSSSSESQPGGQQPGDGSSSRGTGSSGAARGGSRPPAAVGSNVTANATAAAAAPPRLLAYTLEASGFWAFRRLAGLDGNLSLVLAGADCDWLPRQGAAGEDAQLPAELRGATALVSLSRWPSRDPAADCSWRALLAAAARAGAEALLFGAPPGAGPDLQQADCEGSEEACGNPAVAAATVGHRFGAALRLALERSERVNVTFGGLRVGAQAAAGACLPAACCRTHTACIAQAAGAAL